MPEKTQKATRGAVLYLGVQGKTGQLMSNEPVIQKEWEAKGKKKKMSATYYDEVEKSKAKGKNMALTVKSFVFPGG